MLVPGLGPHRVVGQFVPVEVELAAGGNSPGASRRPRVAEHAQLQREAQLVAGAPARLDVLQVDAFAGGVGGQQHLHLRVVPERFLRRQTFLAAHAAVDDDHRRLSAEQGRDALLQVAQRVAVLGEDHQLLMRRGRRPRDRAVTVANRRLPGPAVPSCSREVRVSSNRTGELHVLMLVNSNYEEKSMQKLWIAVVAVSIGFVATVNVASQESVGQLRPFESGCEVLEQEGNNVRIRCARVDDLVRGVELHCWYQDERLRFFAGNNSVATVELGDNLVAFRMVSYSDWMELGEQDVAQIGEGRLTFTLGGDMQTFELNADDREVLQRCAR